MDLKTEEFSHSADSHTSSLSTRSFLNEKLLAKYCKFLNSFSISLSKHS